MVTAIDTWRVNTYMSHPNVDAVRIRSFGIPPRYATLRLADFKPRTGQEDAYETCYCLVDDLRDRYVTSQRPLDDYPEDPATIGRGVLLVGPPGTGKTQLAVATALEIYYTRNLPVRFIALPDYVSKSIELMKLERRDDEDSLQAWLEIRTELHDVETAPVLVLDDVSKEHRASGSDYAKNEVDQLLRARHRNGCPTIITTNLAVDEWGKFYNETLASLLNEAYDISTLSQIGDQRIRVRAFKGPARRAKR